MSGYRTENLSQEELERRAIRRFESGGEENLRRMMLDPNFTFVVDGYRIERELAETWLQGQAQARRDAEAQRDALAARNYRATVRTMVAAAVAATAGIVAALAAVAGLFQLHL